jgi:hypothetical protein
VNFWCVCFFWFVCLLVFQANFVLRVNFLCTLDRRIVNNVLQELLRLSLVPILLSLVFPAGLGFILLLDQLFALSAQAELLLHQINLLFAKRVHLEQFRKVFQCAIFFC